MPLVDIIVHPKKPTGLLLFFCTLVKLRNTPTDFTNNRADLNQVACCVHLSTLLLKGQLTQMTLPPTRDLFHTLESVLFYTNIIYQHSNHMIYRSTHLIMRIIVSCIPVQFIALYFLQFSQHNPCRLHISDIKIIRDATIDCMPRGPYRILRFRVRLRLAIDYWEIILVPPWVNNYMPSKVWGEIINARPYVNGCAVAVWERISNFIPHFTLDVIIYFHHIFASDNWDVFESI